MNTILLATTQSWNSLPDDDGLPEDVGAGPILDGGGGSGISSIDGQPSQYPLYRIIVDVYAVSVLCLVGFVGNTLTIAVLHRDTDQPNTTNWLLQSLAVVDTLYLASCVFIQPIKTINEHTTWMKPTLGRIFPHLEPYIWYLASTAQTMAVWVVLLVTADRYIAVCHPWQQQANIHRRVFQAKVSIFVVILLAIVYNLPRFLERQVIYVLDPLTNETTVKTQKTPFRDNKIYFIVYKTVGYFIFRTVGPLVALVYFNLRLILKLREVKQKRSRLTGSRTSEKKPGCSSNRESITFMLVVVVSVFVVCQLPDLGLRIALTILPDQNFDIWTMRYANAVTNALLTVNSSVNFLIYCLVGKKFRQIFARMYKCAPVGDQEWMFKRGEGYRMTTMLASSTRIFAKTLAINRCEKVDIVDV